MADKKRNKEYVCAYKYCLHHGEKVKSSEAVVISNKHYHVDCAEMKQAIQDCADTYINTVGDKTTYPAAVKIISNLVFNNMVPIEYIRKKIENSSGYYKEKPVHVLYGIRRLYWEVDNKK